MRARYRGPCSASMYCMLATKGAETNNRLISRIRAAARFLTEQGLVSTIRHARIRRVEEQYEKRFGIQTSGQIHLEALGINDPDAVLYVPASYPGFFNAMKHVGKTDGAFVDYGSGLGRILVCASTLGFKRITGVEFAQELVDRAKRNLERAGVHARSHVEIVCTNAAAWQVPSDVTVFHFYNPFRKRTLRTVVANIARSLREHPRQAWILFAFPWEMEPLMRSGEVIPLAWQKDAADEMWPLHPVLENDKDGNRYRVYLVDSRSAKVEAAA